MGCWRDPNLPCRCEHWRSPTDADRVSADTIPLAEQQHRLEAVLAEGPTPLWRWAADNWPLICRAARVRLLQGYRSYGDTMYRWDAETRRQNMLEELADWLAYRSSEPR